MTLPRGRAIPTASTATWSTIGMSSIRCAASRWRCSASSTATSSSPGSLRPCLRGHVRQTARPGRLPHHGRSARPGARARLRGRTRRAPRRGSEAGRLPDLKSLRVLFSGCRRRARHRGLYVPLSAYEELSPGSPGEFLVGTERYMRDQMSGTAPASGLNSTRKLLRSGSRPVFRSSSRRAASGLAGALVRQGEQIDHGAAGDRAGVWRTSPRRHGRRLAGGRAGHGRPVRSAPWACV